MKYKLIKRAPFLPEVGTIFTRDERGQYVAEKPLIIIQEEEIKNYPEFWEEVKEKEYTILSFIGEDGRVWSLIEDKSSRLFGNYKTVGCHVVYTLEPMLTGLCSLEDGGQKIHSVRREKDKEMFQLGDEVTGTGTNFKITEFEIGDFILGGMYACSENVKVSITLIKKAPPRKPILITEDGKEIFENDIYYIVTESFNKFAGRAKPEDFLIAGNKRFSNEEKAEEYIKWNKPMYSLNDVKIMSQNSVQGWSKILANLQRLDRK